MNKNEYALTLWVKDLEKKYNIIIERDGDYFVGYGKVKGKKSKEICREKDLVELQITLKYYMS